MFLETIFRNYNNVNLYKYIYIYIGSLLEARSIAEENSGLSTNDDFNINTKKRTKKPVTYKKNEFLNIQSPPLHNFEGNISQFNDNTYIYIIYL